MISIIMPVKNCVDYTIEALRTMECSYNMEFFFLDDDSSDGTIELHNSYDFYNVSHLPSLAGKWNYGMQIAQGDVVFIVNNDVVFHPNTFDAIVDRMMIDDIAMVTATDIQSAFPQDKRRSIGNIRDFVLNYDVSKTNESECPNFSCFAIRRSDWVQMGGFDESYVPCYFEDNDIHWTLLGMRKKAINLSNSVFYHYGSVTQNSVIGGIAKPSDWDRNRQYFIRKWGKNPQELTREEACLRLPQAMSMKVTKNF